MEAGICFLELRPYFFRSGYMFKDILRKCKQAPLSKSQAARLATVVEKFAAWRAANPRPGVYNTSNWLTKRIGFSRTRLSSFASSAQNATHIPPAMQHADDHDVPARLAPKGNQIRIGNVEE